MWKFDAAGPQSRERILLYAELLATALVYLPTLTFPFAADDASQILGNPRIHSWIYIPEYFKTHVWGHLSLGSGERGAAFYRPVFLLWELATWLLFGKNTAGWHLSALAVHLLATALVYFVARRLTRDSIAGLIAALLFGVYPIHVEAVTWVSGATEPLCAVPFLGAILCWLRAYDSPRPLAWRSGAVALYAVALLAKETAIMLPAVLAAYELSMRSDRVALVRRLMPYAVVTLLYFGVRQLVLAGTAHTPIPVSVLLLTWPSVLWFYMHDALLPMRLSLLNDVSLLNEFSWKEVGFRAMYVVAIGWFVTWCVRKSRIARFALAWAVLALLPPLYLRAFSPVEIAHDRYLYLPSVGVCLLFALGLRRMPLRDTVLATGALAAFFSILTVVESHPWRDEVALFSRAVELAPHSWHARRQLGFALERSQRCDDAMPILATIVDATPDDHVAMFAMGACYFKKGQFVEAERMMRRTIGLHPTYQQPYLLLATIMVGEGRVDEAEEQWRQSRAVQLGPPEPSFHLVRAEILKARGDVRGAIVEYRKELELQPGNDEITASLLRAEDMAARKP